MPFTPSQIRASKSLSVLVKKSNSQNELPSPSEPSDNNLPLGSLGRRPSQCHPSSTSLRKRLTSQFDLFPARQNTAQIAEAPLTSGGKLSALDLDLYPPQGHDSESSSIQHGSRASHTDLPPLMNKPWAKKVLSKASFTKATKMGNNTSSLARKDKRHQTESPETDITDDGCSAPNLLPTSNHISPLRLLLRRASASTLHLPSGKRASKTEHSPTRLAKLQEYTSPESESTSILSSTPVPANPSLSLPDHFGSSSSDQGNVTEGKAAAYPTSARPLTLSPPLTGSALSPPISSNTSRPSSGHSQAPSSIYSPFQKPHGPIAILAPAINLTHYDCYQSHFRMIKLPNKHYPVPCMICKVDNREQRWKCTWCCLRICTDCMDSLKSIEERSLRTLVRRIEQRKEQHWTSMGGQSGVESSKNIGVRKTESSEVTIKSPKESTKQSRQGLAAK